MNLKEDDEEASSSQKKVIIFKFSQKKKLITRDWPEESFLSSKEKKVKTLSKKKSVSFNKETQDIPPLNQDPGKCTPSKELKDTAKTIKSCKEHIKTPYSKQRVNDDEVEYSYSKVRDCRHLYEMTSLQNSNSKSMTPLLPSKGKGLIDMIDDSGKDDDGEDNNDHNELLLQHQGEEKKPISLIKNKEHNKENIEPSEIENELSKIKNDLLQMNEIEDDSFTEKIEENSDDDDDVDDLNSKKEKGN